MDSTLRPEYTYLNEYGRQLVFAIHSTCDPSTNIRLDGDRRDNLFFITSPS